MAVGTVQGDTLRKILLALEILIDQEIDESDGIEEENGND